MKIRPIRTDREHKAALAEIEACWGSPEGSEQGDKLDVLLALVEIYQARRWPADTAKRFDPIDVLNYAIDELGHTRAELAELLSSRSVHRNFSLAGAPRLAGYLHRGRQIDHRGCRRPPQRDLRLRGKYHERPV